MSKNRSVGASLQGLTRLLSDATLGVTDLVEAMQQQVLHPPLVPATPIQRLISRMAGFTYQKIRWGTQFISGGLQTVLAAATPLLGEMTDEQEAIQAALNGIVGDHLEATDNPLKISMQCKHQGKEISLDPNHIKEAYPAINGKILLMVHGLCMNDRQWTHKGHNHGLALAQELGKTPVYLHYNSGRHISTNGQELNKLLEKLLQHWPVPVEELVILAHSMGGLVSRSALHYGHQSDAAWPRHLKKMVFLGTPHHGSPLERGGNYVDVLLESIPYARPFARLGKIRSAGLTDLRYGNLREEDWQGRDRFELSRDPRKHIPFPDEVEGYSIAAVREKTTDLVPLGQSGDGLVPLQSALGQHQHPVRSLGFREKNTWVAYETGHFELLSDPGVYAKIKAWLEAAAR